MQKTLHKRIAVKKKTFYILCLVFSVLGLAGITYGCSKKSDSSVQSKEINVDVQTVNHKQKDIYTTAYQKESDAKLKSLKSKDDYSTENPLIIENLYGTNTTSLYYYAKTDQASYAVATIETTDKKSVAYKHTLQTVSGDKYVKQHEYQIIGLVPNTKNKITMQFFNKKNKPISKTCFYVTTKKDSSIPKMEKTAIGKSKVKMTDGLFAMMGRDQGALQNNGKAVDANVFLWDNNGVCRGRIPLNDYKTDRLLFIKNEMVYSYDINHLAFVNRLGKVTKTISLGDYQLHHDFMYDKHTNKILCLVSINSKTTIEDSIISVDATSGQVKLLLDTEDVLPNIKNIATQEENGGLNYSGTTDLDWIHVNSFDFVDDDSLILSSREQSSLIKVSNIYEKPELDYIIHYGTLYKGSGYEDKLLTRKGNLVAPAGQHTVTVEKDDSLPDGQYYIYMFNNNYGRVTAFPEFDWSSYKDLSPSSNPKTGTSYYSKYLVDEKNGTYTLAQEFKLPYSSIVSSVQHLGGNIPYSSGRSKIFGEYDKDGNLIKSFRYDAQQFSYRVLKYNFKGFYFR